MTYQKHFILLCLILLSAFREPEISKIHLPNNGVLLFQDPLGDVFDFCVSDTFSGFNFDKSIYSTYKASSDSSRMITYHCNELYLFQCDTLNALESLKMERERILKRHGTGVINDSAVINEGSLVDAVYVSYISTNYILTFCDRGRYIRLEFENFGNEEHFKTLLKSFRFN